MIIFTCVAWIVFIVILYLSSFIAIKIEYSTEILFDARKCLKYMVIIMTTFTMTLYLNKRNNLERIEKNWRMWDQFN